MSPEEPTAALQAWIRSCGGFWHDSLITRRDEEWGLHLGTSSDLIPETTNGTLAVMTCPVELVVTKELAIRTLIAAQVGVTSHTTGINNGVDSIERLSEKQLVASYIALHLAYGGIAQEDLPAGVDLPHATYVSSLPCPTTSPILTPLYWNSAEQHLINGTNLDYAANEMEKKWRAEYEQARESVCQGGLEGLKREDDSSRGISWDHYRLANTYITSRAFPSTLLTSPSTLNALHNATSNSSQAINPENLSSTQQQVKDAYPILIPGIDLFNHRRGEPVTWTSSGGEAVASSSKLDLRQVVAGAVGDTEGRGHIARGITLSLRGNVGAGEQVFNNYGPKGNEELILGYGFALPDNPDDTCVLRLGGVANLPEDILAALNSADLDPSEMHHVRRDGEIPEKLQRIVRICVCGEDMPPLDEGLLNAEQLDEDGLERLEIEVDVMQMLLGLLEGKLSSAQAYLKRVEDLQAGPEIRPTVKNMCIQYAKGQYEVLRSCSSRYQAVLGSLDAALEPYV